MMWIGIIIAAVLALAGVNALGQWLDDRSKGIIRGKGHVVLNYDGLPTCPECEVGMTWLKDSKEARCHDCGRVYPKPPDWDAQEDRLLARELSREVRSLRERVDALERKSGS